LRDGMTKFEIKPEAKGQQQVIIHVTLYLYKEEREKLKALANRHKMKMNKLCRDMVRHCLKDLRNP